MNLERTEWYPEEILPSVPGVYEVKSELAAVVFHSYWNGERFCYRVLGFNKAMHLRNKPTRARPTATWRGLTKQSFLMMKEMKHAL